MTGQVHVFDPDAFPIRPVPELPTEPAMPASRGKTHGHALLDDELDRIADRIVAVAELVRSGAHRTARASKVIDAPNAEELGGITYRIEVDVDHQAPAVDWA